MIPLPVLHIGGTHRNCLHEDYLKAQNALYDAIQAFDGIEFNSRDYFLNNSWDAAVAKRTEVREQLLRALTYLDAHSEHTAPPLS